MKGIYGNTRRVTSLFVLHIFTSVFLTIYILKHFLIKVARFWVMQVCISVICVLSISFTLELYKLTMLTKKKSNLFWWQYEHVDTRKSNIVPGQSAVDPVKIPPSWDPPLALFNINAVHTCDVKQNSHIRGTEEEINMYGNEETLCTKMVYCIYISQIFCIRS